MKLLDQIHEKFIFTSRVNSLSKGIADLLPPAASVLDVGCGSGLIAAQVCKRRPDVNIEGIDVLLRDETYIPVQLFDGKKIPFPDNSFDTVMFVDVLHHTDDPVVLLKEAKRVASNTIVLKDHNMNGFLAFSTLKFMDVMGNARFGVSLPYNYLKSEEWFEIYQSLNLDIEKYDNRLKLYPSLINFFFGRSLHFLASLSVNPA